MFDHGIENGEQLAHASDQGDFERFTVGPQAFVEIANHGVAPGGDQRRYVQSAANRSSPTPNGASAFECAAVAIEGGQTRQSG